MGVTPSLAIEQKIIRRITREAWTEFKTRDLQRAIGATRNYSADELEEILEGLENSNHLRRVTTSLKPLRTHWTVNPALVKGVAAIAITTVASALGVAVDIARWFHA